MNHFCITLSNLDINFDWIYVSKIMYGRDILSTPLFLLCLQMWSLMVVSYAPRYHSAVMLEGFASIRLMIPRGASLLDVCTHNRCIISLCSFVVFHSVIFTSVAVANWGYTVAVIVYSFCPKKDYFQKLLIQQGNSLLFIS